MRSHLLEGKVRHRRSNPFVYELEHDVFYLALDTSELDRIGRMKLLGRNRWRPFTFRDDDHWKPAADDIDATVRAHLRDEGFEAAGFQWSSSRKVKGRHRLRPRSFMRLMRSSSEVSSAR